MNCILKRWRYHISLRLIGYCYKLKRCTIVMVNRSTRFLHLLIIKWLVSVLLRLRRWLMKKNSKKAIKGISIDIIKSCSEIKVYYNHQSSGSTSKTWMGTNSRTALYMNKGDKLWIADENGNNLSVIFEPTSYSQDGMDVYLCR